MRFMMVNISTILQLHGWSGIGKKEAFAGPNDSCVSVYRGPDSEGRWLKTVGPVSASVGAHDWFDGFFLPNCLKKDFRLENPNSHPDSVTN